MKRKYIKIIFVIIGSSFILASCTKKLSELNKDPNSYQKVNTDFLFTSSMLDAVGGDRFSWMIRFNLMASLQQEATYSLLTAPGDKYLSEGYGSFLWNSYSSCVREIEDVIQNVKDDPNMINKLAIARIWRVYMFHRLTDLFGDIPYFQAGKGLEGQYQPKYDKQSDIYPDMLKQLEESANSLDASKPTFGSSDLFYGGNVIQWKKFAFSLMLRLGMHLTKVDLTSAETWVKKAIAGGPILEDVDLAKISYFDGSLASNRNPLSAQWLELDYVNPQDPNNIQGCKISKRFIDQLKGNSTTTKDPRLNAISVLWVKQPSGLYVKDTATALQNGMENAKYNSYPADYETFSEPNPKTVMSYSAPICVMTPAEVNFLLTEAAIRGWYAGNVGDAYSNGVKAAMKQWSLYGSEGVISQDKVDYYLTNNPFKLSGSFEEKLDQISTQKWILFYVDQIENFANWRRTNYPVLIHTNYPGNLTGGQIPRRMVVPDSEELYNKDNFIDAKTRQSGDNTLLSRVWWDKE
ncbi:MAG: SusD/RagB family nutrient-binding outer membrane lipoprotein [Ginsengibacter sp.]